MQTSTWIHCYLLYGLLCILPPLFTVMECFSEEERISLREETREMFIHAYDSYMQHAYPADELMPLSCRGRFRGVEANRGDVDDALGNFSLTLIDTLDSLVILGNYSEFDDAAFRIVSDVSFDQDIVVSVFETNIRIVGGLLSAHVLALVVKAKQNSNGYLQWYNSQLLDMAKDIGLRLLPAFETTTGIPHPRINLKYGLNSAKIGSLRETCTSCAGTMILEFAALSRLTGDPVFEEKARTAMDYLWQKRHRQSNLMGNVLNINTGDWVRKESGVGAGIDSYYEYCLKAYILLGDESYLHRFNRHYAGVMKYVSQGPLLIDVHMHRPHSQAKNFMDSLLAFWPGLQVLKGDLRPAIETHEVLYQVTQRHTFLPEAFTVDRFNVHWPHHPLRPEFIESTYFLYQATGDEHYLQVGKEALSSLQNYTRVPCGFAAVNDVRTKKKEDRMDSFFLAETLKYLYLLFSKKGEIDLNLEDYVFTTEGHLLPLSLGQMKWPPMTTATETATAEQSEAVNSTQQQQQQQSVPPVRRKGAYFSSTSSDFFCPSTKAVLKENARRHFSTCSRSAKQQQHHQHLMDSSGYYKLIRKGVEDFASRPSSTSSTTSSSSSSSHRLRHPSLLSVPRLRAADFSAAKPEHIELLKGLGISVLVLKDGRVQLVHNSAAAWSMDDAEEGALFMQEMIALSKMQVAEETRLRMVSFTLKSRAGTDSDSGSSSSSPPPNNEVNISLLGGPAQFGLDLAALEQPVSGELVRAEPAIDACHLEEIGNRAEMAGRVVLAQRGGCMFIEKARNVQRLGALGIIIADNAEGSSSKTMPMFAMSGDGSTDVVIPAVFLYTADAKILFGALEESTASGSPLVVRLEALNEDNQDEVMGHNGEQQQGSTVDRETMEQMFREEEKKKENSEGASSSSASSSSSLSFFDRLNSQMKFDLLSALNLKDLKEENMKLIVGLLSKLALTKEQKKDQEQQGEEEAEDGGEEASLASLLRRMKESRRWMHSLHTDQHCANPLGSTDAFLTFLYEPYTVCV